MSVYPGAIYAPRTKNNKEGVVYAAAEDTTLFAEDVVKLDDEVVAIQTVLGTDPEGDYGSVADRIVGQSSEAARYLGGRRLFKTDFQGLQGAYIYTSGTAAKSAAFNGMLLTTGATSGSYYTANYSFFPYGSGANSDKNPRIAFLIKLDQSTDQLLYLLNGASDYYNSFGFKIEDDVLYAYSHYFDEEEEDHIYEESIVATVTDTLLLEAVYTSGVSIKYYVNGVLKKTQTTGLPEEDPYLSTGIQLLDIYFENLTAATKYVQIFFAEIEWDS